MAITSKLARKIYDAEKNRMDSLRGAEILAPEFKELEKEREKRRDKRQEAKIKKLALENLLAKNLNLKKARDIFWAFTGRDLYRMLVIEQGWSSEAYEAWLADTLMKVVTDESMHE